MWDIVLRNYEIIIKLLLAVVVGGFTGYERERSNQFAGFRTHILVSIGSCITSIIALDLYSKYSGTSNIDPGRLPAQVLSGIGFLGAGAILKNSNGIRGLTTAAGIWTTACIGIAIGYGQYILAISAWILVMATLYVLKNIDKVISPKSQTILKVTIKSLDATSQVVNIIKCSEMIIRNFEIIFKSESLWEVHFILDYDKKLILEQLIIELENIKNVVDVEYIK